VAAGPLYMVVGLAQAFTREGFDMRRHALSLLSNGDLGWIQITSFMVTGALVIAGALGVRRRLHPGRGGTWAPILLGLYGAGLIGSGIFVADPGAGFPPGTVPPPTMTTSGLLHFVFGGLGFYALIAAGLVFARRFRALGQRGWALYSVLTSVGFFAAFAVIASGSTSSAAIVMFYVAVAWVWAWHAGVSARLMVEHGSSVEGDAHPSSR
ncbi:MAG TPA: DUF998 domain-containing protein, partial [Longimicrobiales bacterium]|nr:DUF998 domain-containing protein [Longimicrobiales bacterium]